MPSFLLRPSEGEAEELLVLKLLVLKSCIHRTMITVFTKKSVHSLEVMSSEKKACLKLGSLFGGLYF